MSKLFDRSLMQHQDLALRQNRLRIQEIALLPEQALEEDVSPRLLERIQPLSRQILEAQQKGAAIICAFGAHAIKNGLGPLLAAFLKRGWFTHLATNGAGIIHDWEFAYQGKSSEDVKANVLQGSFGTWQQTGLYINLSISLGAYEGLGYGQSVGAMINRQGLSIPDQQQLEEDIKSHSLLWKRAAAADLLLSLQTLGIPSGFLSIPHPYKEASLQASADEVGFPLTGHPMFGHDIIYTHQASSGAAIGRTAERDFLSFVNSVSQLQNGVYLSVGSGVMSPMIFEKSLSMARNAGKAEGNRLTDAQLFVVDLQPETWDWTKGEPPESNPAYYQRFMKTFHRMGCPVDYLCADNRLFFQGLYQSLHKASS